MSPVVLHYVHDPLCGWCYGAAPLVRAAVTAGVPVALHGGGLIDAPTNVPVDKRRMMRTFDLRIGAMTGQPFGTAYLDGLLADPEAIWWSRPPIAAVLAAEATEAGQALPMVAAIQRAHYVEGRRVAGEPALVEAARSIGLDPDRFAAALRAAPVDEHIRDTRGLMRDHGLGGFPSFLLERGGRLARMTHETLYGHPDAFVAAIRTAEAAGLAPA